MSLEEQARQRARDMTDEELVEAHVAAWYADVEGYGETLRQAGIELPIYKAELLRRMKKT